MGGGVGNIFWNERQIFYGGGGKGEKREGKAGLERGEGRFSGMHALVEHGGEYVVRGPARHDGREVQKKGSKRKINGQEKAREGGSRIKKTKKKNCGR